MLPVDVQHIHGSRSEIWTGILKAGPQQSRKSTELGVVEGLDVGEYFFSVEPSVLVAKPGVYGISATGAAVGCNALTECKIRVPAVSPEFDEDCGGRNLREPESEGNVTNPGPWRFSRRGSQYSSVPRSSAPANPLDIPPHSLTVD